MYERKFKLFLNMKKYQYFGQIKKKKLLHKMGERVLYSEDNMQVFVENGIYKTKS